MPDHDRDLEQGPRAPYPAGQRTAAMTARPDEHRHQIGQLATRELDLYGSQLARCLKALGTRCPDTRRCPARTSHGPRRARLTRQSRRAPRPRHRGQARRRPRPADRAPTRRTGPHRHRRTRPHLRARKGYGQDKPERCSRRPDRRSRTSTFVTAEGSGHRRSWLFSAAVDQAFRAESFGFSEVGAGVRFRGRVFSEALDCAWEGPRPDSAGTTADQRERFLLRLSALSWLYPFWSPRWVAAEWRSWWRSRPPVCFLNRIRARS